MSTTKGRSSKTLTCWRRLWSITKWVIFCMWIWMDHLTLTFMRLICPIGVTLCRWLDIFIIQQHRGRISSVETPESWSMQPLIPYGSMPETSSIHTLPRSITKSTPHHWQLTPFTHKAHVHSPFCPLIFSTCRCQQMVSI